MATNYLDAATKELIWDDPAAWLERMGIDPAGGVEVVDSDATTLVSTADKVIRVGGENPFLVDLEPHSYHDSELVRTLWMRQVALDHRHNLPVLTVLILLHKRANSPDLSGSYTRELPDGRLTNRYDYRVVRLWQEDPEPYLNGGLAVVPLAPLTNVAEADLPALVDRMHERIGPEPTIHARILWGATYLLMGFRFDEDLVGHLLEGVIPMLAESSTYQKILRDGRREGHQEGRQEGRQEGLREGQILGERRLLIRQGTRKFGEPDAATVAAIDAILDPDRLVALGERIIDANVLTWADLLQAS